MTALLFIVPMLTIPLIFLCIPHIIFKKKKKRKKFKLVKGGKYDPTIKFK